MNIQAIWHCSRSKRKLKQHYHLATVSGGRDPAAEQKLKQGSYRQSFEGDISALASFLSRAVCRACMFFPQRIWLVQMFYAWSIRDLIKGISCWSSQCNVWEGARGEQDGMGGRCRAGGQGPSSKGESRELYLARLAGVFTKDQWPRDHLSARSGEHPAEFRTHRALQKAGLWWPCYTDTKKPSSSYSPGFRCLSAGVLPLKRHFCNCRCQPWMRLAGDILFIKLKAGDVLNVPLT